jgi:2-methylcitrate dehydratase PrpD
MGMAPSLSRVLAEYVAGVSLPALPREVVDITKLTFLDWLGNAWAGSRYNPSRWVREVLAEQGGAPQATVIAPWTSAGDRQKTSVLSAALANGTSSHIVELDDVHKGAILHAGTVVIPGALALAEYLGAPGWALIEAIVAGFDVCIRIGEAVTPAHYRYFHTTGTVGTFGAAAAAAKLLRLTVDQTVHAFGTAGTQAAGLWEFIENGSMSKHLHAGKAAWNGVFSAIAAARGITGADTILEGRRGFLRALAGEYDIAKITDGLGEWHKIRENCFKIHASCRHTHHAIDLVLQLVDQHQLSPADIVAIRVGTYPVALDITDNPHPQTVYAAKFSLQFCTALAAVRRSAGLDDFTDETLHHPVVRDLLHRVEVYVDDECAAKYPARWAARVEVVTTSGRTFAASTDYPRGDFENPVTAQELTEKFERLTQDALPTSSRARIVERVMALEALPSTGTLFDGL